MVRGLSQLFAAGPAVVDAMGEDYEGNGARPSLPKWMDRWF